MTEFISRKYGNEGYEVIIKTDSEADYKSAEEFARKLIDHAKPVTDNNVGSKWIPVTERLPDVWQHPGDDEHAGEPIEFIVFIRGALIPTTLWFNGESFFDESGYLYNVTHWMPLPEPPKGE